MSRKRQPLACPVCGKHRFTCKWDYDICPHCGWENDGSEEDNIGGANELPFSEFKERYEHYLLLDPSYKWKKDGFPEAN